MGGVIIQRVRVQSNSECTDDGRTKASQTKKIRRARVGAPHLPCTIVSQGKNSWLVGVSGRMVEFAEARM